MKKIVSYLPFAALLILPLLFYPMVATSNWVSSSDIHASLEFAASLLAITAGIMILADFLTTGRWFFLMISIGFVLIGSEEFVHAIFSLNRIWPEIPPTFKLAISSTWLAGRFVLLLSLFLALVLRGRKNVLAERETKVAGSMLLGFIGAAAMTVFIFNLPALPSFVQLGSTTKKLIELSLAALFFVAFLLYSNIYLSEQPRSPLLGSIVACLIVQVLAHIFVFDARVFYDAHWDTAHLLVVLGYLFPIYGVWGETVQLHKFNQVKVVELGKEMAEHKRAEEALRESEERFRAIISNTPDHIIMQDRDLRYVLVINPQLGLKEADMVGKTDQDFLEAADAEALTTTKRRVLETGERVRLEVPLQNLKGEDEFFEGAYIPRFDATGKTNGLIGYFRNITERKRAEEALRESEKQYRLLFDEMLSGFATHEIICDPTGKPVNYRFLSVNAAFERMTGLAADTIIGKTVLEALPGTETLWIERYGQVALTREPALFENYAGALGRYFEVRAFSPKPGKIATIFNDITERKQAEAVLRESEARLRAILNATPFPIALVDVQDNNIEFWSQSALTLFGHTAPTAAEWYQIAYPDPDYRSEVVQRWKPFLEEARPSARAVNTGEYRVACRDGSVRICELYAAFLANNLIVTFNDITDRKRAEAALQEYSERLETMVEARTRELQAAQQELVRQNTLAALGQLAGEVSHELRNPLGVITNAIYFLGLVLPDTDPKVKEYLDIIHSETRAADKIVTDLLDFSRPGAAEPELVRVSELAARTLRRYPPPASIHLTQALPEDLPLLWADLRQLEQALGNLILNAYQAMPEGGQLGLTAQAAGEQVRLSVVDTGSGIAAEHMGRLFEPLFTTKPRGIGLGLAVSKKLIEANGGKIEVQSAPGRGSTFTVLLPTAGKIN